MIKNIPISIDFDEIQKEAQEKALFWAKKIATDNISKMFCSGSDHFKSLLNLPEGLGHEIIRKKVEEYILSDKFAEMVDRLIDEHVEEQATEAIKTLLNSRSRKYLFEPTEHKPG